MKVMSQNRVLYKGNPRCILPRRTGPMQEETPLDIYTDGASRGNPGPSCFAYIFVENGTITVKKAGFLGEMTSNAAEYHAVRNALLEALSRGYGEIRLYTDSQLVMRQITGTYRTVHPVLGVLCREVRDLARRFRQVSFHHLPRNNRFLVQADTLCNRCLDAQQSHRMEERSLEITPIGVIHAPFLTRESAPRQGRFTKEESELEIFPRYEKGLRDVEHLRHLIVVYWAHEASREILEARPPHSHEDHGVFATRSPDRPNPLSLCVVELICVTGNRIRVRWLDAVDGSPLVDIKPFSQEIDCPPDLKPIT